MSLKLSDPAATRIRTWPGPGSGTGMSATSHTSPGGPLRTTRRALMQISRSKWQRGALVAAAILASLALGAEAVFWLGSTLAEQPAVAGRCAVLVLGHPATRVVRSR